MPKAQLKTLTVVFVIAACGVSFLTVTPTRAASDKATPLWDQWYTISVKRHHAHYGYYHESVENLKGRLHFQNDVWKKEEDYINRESLGAFATDNAELTPLFYNYRSTFRTSETTIDGNIETNGASRFFTAKGRAKGVDLPVIKKGLPLRTFFEIFFPVWLDRRLNGAQALKENQSASFSTLTEDDLDNEFAVEEGTVRLEKPDAMATQLHAKKVTVDFRNMRSLWWISDKGYAERIEMPAQELVVERVPRAKAEAFLQESPNQGP